MSVHVIEAKFLLLEVSTTTLSPRIWHVKSVHITEAKFLLRRVYYYIETNNLTHEVSTHHWGQVSTAKGLLLHWVPVSVTMMSVHMIEAKFLLLEVSTTTLSFSIWHMTSVRITEAKFLQLNVNTTTLSPSTWGQVPLQEVSTTTLSPSSWHNDVSTHHWG